MNQTDREHIEALHREAGLEAIWIRVAKPAKPRKARKAKETTRREVVYVASPVATYETARYDMLLGYVTSHYPGAEILPAKGLYGSTAIWLRDWPEHLKRLTAVVYFADTDGSVGKGVYKEIEDALVRSIPVHYLTDSGDLIPHGDVDLQLINGGESWRRYARVVLPKPAKQLNKTARKQSKAAHPGKEAEAPTWGDRDLRRALLGSVDDWEAYNSGWLSEEDEDILYFSLKDD